MNKTITPEGIINEALKLKDKVDDSEFPVSIFPREIQSIIRSTNQCSDYPIDYIASAILTASATAIGNTYAVKIKDNWLESSILYVVVVGSPGQNKSHPVSFAFEPLLSKDKISDFEYRQACREYEEFKLMTKKERDELFSTTILEEPKQKKLVVSDITVESLISTLHNNPRGLSVYVDELNSWITAFTRYKNTSDESFWLSLYSAKPIVVNRKNIQGSISVYKPFITVIGTIQTGLLRELAEGNRSKNGFIDRLLFVYPRKQLKKYWSKEVLPSYITTRWKHTIDKLLDIELILDDYGSPIPKSIPYSPEALNMLYEWQKYNTDLSNQETDEIVKGIYSKLEIYISRFALILQLLKFVCNEADKDQIDTETTQGAIELTEYFRTMAIRVQNSLNFSEVLKEIPTDKKELFNQLPADFSTGEGIIIAGQMSISKDNFNRFLRDFKDILFENYKYGRYKKIF